MKLYLVPVAVIFGLLLSTQANAISEKDLASARNYALSNQPLNTPYESRHRGTKVITTVESVTIEEADILCKTYRQSILEKDRTTKKYEVTDDSSGEACKFGHKWIVLGSREHEAYIAKQERLVAQQARAMDKCRGRRTERNRGVRASTVERAVRTGDKRDARRIAGEWIGSLFPETRTYRTCSY